MTFDHGTLYIGRYIEGNTVIKLLTLSASCAKLMSRNQNVCFTR
jgi:hypothetical protein